MRSILCTFLALGFSAAAASAGGKPHKPGTLVVDAISEPDNICSITSTMAASSDFQNLVFESLWSLDDNLEDTLVLGAEIPSIENGGIARDGLSYRAKLKPNLKWADGQPLTSADLKFTLEANRDFAQYTEPYEKIASIECPDATTVVVKMKEVWATMDQDIVGVPVLPKHVCGAFKTRDDWIKSDFVRNPVGSGPFKLDRWVTDEYLIFSRNPNYNGRPAPMERIIVKIIPDKNTRVTQLMTGELDWYQQVEFPQRKILLGLPEIQVKERSTFMYTHLDFNMQHKKFHDRRLRQAIAHAIDKKALVDGIFEGRAEVADTIVHPGLKWAYNPNVPKYPYDPAKSKLLLEAMGFRAGRDGVYEKDGQRLSIELVRGTESKVGDKIFGILQQRALAAGIEFVGRAIPGSVLFDSDPAKGVLNGGKYEMAMFSWALSSEPIGQFNVWKSDRFPPKGQNSCFYSNPEVDKIAAQASKTIDRKARAVLYKKFQEVLMTDLATVPLYYRPMWGAHRSVLENVKMHPIGNVGNFWNPSQWRWRNTAQGE